MTPRLRAVTLRRDVKESIREELEIICKQIKDGVRNCEKVGLKIQLNDLYPLHIEYRFKESVNVNVLLNRMSKLTHSHRTLKITHIYVEAKIINLCK